MTALDTLIIVLAGTMGLYVGLFAIRSWWRDWPLLLIAALAGYGLDNLLRSIFP